MMRKDGVLFSFVYPAEHAEVVQALVDRQASCIAMDKIPRISRAQMYDALSSMANVAGYRAVVEASHVFGRSFMGQITAAGKIAPCKVLVIGAGVAGLAALGAAKGMGAVVRGFDTREVCISCCVCSFSSSFSFLDLIFRLAGSRLSPWVLSS